MPQKFHRHYIKCISSCKCFGHLLKMDSDHTQMHDLVHCETDARPDWHTVPFKDVFMLDLKWMQSIDNNPTLLRDRSALVDVITIIIMNERIIRKPVNNVPYTCNFFFSPSWTHAPTIFFSFFFLL